MPRRPAGARHHDPADPVPTAPQEQGTTPPPSDHTAAFACRQQPTDPSAKVLLGARSRIQPDRQMQVRGRSHRDSGDVACCRCPAQVCEVVLRVEVERGQGEAGVALFGDDAGPVAAWVHPGDGGHRVELARSHDGEVALVVVDEVIAAVRLPDGHVAASDRAGRGIEASFPLDGTWTLDIAGELIAHGGQTGYQGGVVRVLLGRTHSRPCGTGSRADPGLRRARRGGEPTDPPAPGSSPRHGRGSRPRE